jgi:hypothetical protein
MALRPRFLAVSYIRRHVLGTSQRRVRPVHLWEVEELMA